MKKWIVCAALLSAAGSLQAATITYNASIGCAQSCVTVSMSWSGEPFGVNFADVEDESDNVLFALNMGTFAGQTTGAIVPYPQTISSLSSNTISLISSGQAYLSLTEIAPGLLGGGEGPGSDGTPFLAAPVPEPGAGWLTLAGLGALLLYARAQRTATRAPLS